MSPSQNATGYAPIVALRHERETRIQRAVKAHYDKHPIYEYQNRLTLLPRIRVSVDLPIYRMENYRTRTEQLQSIQEHGYADNFFLSGQENESAQHAQHRILVSLAAEGSGSITPIIDALQTEEQRDPLVITSAGVVVNGNRRLAAMRELYTRDPHRYKHFSHADCAVLPSDATTRDIRETEVRLQMLPETKLPYNWVAEAIAISEMMNDGQSREDIARLMKKKPRQIDHQAQVLTEVDLYLREWERQPHRYDLVLEEKRQQIFNDLAKALRNKGGDDAEVRRRIAWTLIANKNPDGRVYNYNFSFAKQAGEVCRALKSRLDVGSGRASDEGSTGEEESELEVDVAAANGSGDALYRELIDIFDDGAERENTDAAVIAVCKDVFDQNQHGEVGRRALGQVQAAVRKLELVDLTAALPETYSALEDGLTSLEEWLDRLKGTLRKLKSGPS